MIHLVGHNTLARSRRVRSRDIVTRDYFSTVVRPVVAGSRRSTRELNCLNQRRKRKIGKCQFMHVLTSATRWRHCGSHSYSSFVKSIRCGLSYLNKESEMAKEKWWVQAGSFVSRHHCCRGECEGRMAFTLKTFAYWLSYIFLTFMPHLSWIMSTINYYSHDLHVIYSSVLVSQWVVYASKLL